MKLEKDTEIGFPHFIIVKASAGSGKTEALTKRYVQFLLSAKIPLNNLKNLLAITFSNNAANEMRSRILLILKELYFQDADQLREFKELLSLPEKDISKKAGLLISEILENYSDFQVRTIDSLMAKIFRAEAFNFAYPPDIELYFSSAETIRRALDTYFDILLSSEEGQKFADELIRLVEEQKRAYLWDPTSEIYKKIEGIHRAFGQTSSEIVAVGEIERRKKCEERIIGLFNRFLELAKDGNLEFNASMKVDVRFEKILRSKRFSDFLEFYGKKFPINKPNARSQSLEHYEKAKQIWQEIDELLKEYSLIQARSFYEPYIRVFKDLLDILEEVKRRERRVFFEDINKKISQNLNSQIVPDIYFKMGETIYHFFIDEFQDTSPIQWFNLRPLIENSLSEGGSLFIVGDTKQAIYTFRGADYKIMKDLIKDDPFYSARQGKRVENLKVNWRSKKKIVEFVSDLFQKNPVLLSNYKDSLLLTGLCEIEQEAKRIGDGYVEIEEIPQDDRAAKKDYILSRISDLRRRGYLYRDIAILGWRNSDILSLASILNEAGLPFISLSSLDLRCRKIISEIIMLLSFLDSPIDDFSFSSFLLSDIFRSLLKKRGLSFDPLEILLIRTGSEPMYKRFQSVYPDLWEAFFKKIFRLAGYLPIYDLLSVIYEDFDLFDLFPGEEAALLRLLEVVRTFEARGYGSMRDFIEFLSSTHPEKGIFDISLPIHIDAVTLMTIHKSKGLGFPALFVYLEDFHIQNKDLDQVTIDDGKFFTLIRLTTTLSKCNEDLQRLRNEKERSIIADFLNLLYVAFTRAKDELYVLCCVKNDKRFPFDFLKSFFGKVYGTKEERAISESEYEEGLSLPRWKSCYSFEVESARPLVEEEKERGELIHKVLGSLEYLDRIDEEEIKEIVRINASILNYPGDIGEITNRVIDILSWEEIAQIFERRPDRKIKNEFEISDPSGNLFRLDRLIIDKEEIRVVEYKTGELREEDIRQLSNYKNLVSSLFEGKNVKAQIFYLKKRNVVSI
jgi:ATP-dependent exoDNAse (exonuclease V) beta subunit